MLFHSPQFLFVFLPVLLAAFFFLQWKGRQHLQAPLLLGASVVFYAGWSLAYTPLLLISAGVNFFFGTALLRHPRRWLLVLALAFNLGLLGYFKYAAFLVQSVNDVADLRLAVPHIVLPLGISFFTFTQIAFLVDAFRRQVHDRDPGRYFLFVTYFPHLIAGPIIHHEEMTRQFRSFAERHIGARDIGAGMTMFAIGLFKKIALADSFGPFVAQGFATLSRDGHLSASAAWLTMLGYALQLYFDFSGYCDMAVGLSRMFGVRLPANFNSPYKSVSIADFWTRWHMTLSRFLRDYLYIPLGGNRRGALRSHVNVLITMLLGGIWHGAGWTFLLWGGLHGSFIVLHRLWHNWAGPRSVALPRPLAVALTFTLVVLAWVPFRAPDFAMTFQMYRSMAGASGLGLPDLETAATIALGLAIVWFLPNSQELLVAYRPVLNDTVDAARAGRLRWNLDLPHAAALACLLAAAILFASDASEFLYFQF